MYPQSGNTQSGGVKESKKKSLSLSKVAGVYFILVGGLVFSIIVGVIEFLYIRSKQEFAVACMMPEMDCIDNEEDPAFDDMNHKVTNGQASPVNGNTNPSIYFGNDSANFSPPKITFDSDANTAV